MPLTNQPSKTLWFDHRVPGLAVIEAHRDCIDFPAHTHDAYTICAVTEGDQVISLGKRSVTARAGDVIVMAPGSLHSSVNADSGHWSYILIHAPASLIGDAIGHTNVSALEISVLGSGVVSDRNFFPIVIECAHTLRDDDSVTEKQNALKSLMNAIATAHAASAPGAVAASQAGNLSYAVNSIITDNPGGSVPLHEMASHAGVSTFHLVRAYRNANGITPHAHLLNQRTIRAMIMLFSKKSLSAIAQESGFYDQSHFTSTFVARTGCTPGAYREWIQVSSTDGRNFYNYIPMITRRAHAHQSITPGESDDH